jgi:hypothetical protein
MYVDKSTTICHNVQIYVILLTRLNLYKLNRNETEIYENIN